MKHVLKPLVFLLAAIYFLVDAVFLTIARPIARRLANLRVFDRLRAWIVSLRPYPTLALFMTPVVILEPVKPVAAFLTATGHVISGLTVFLFGELTKLIMMERLFCICRNKLMSIAAFAWCYDKFRQARAWFESFRVWQLARRLSLIARYFVRRHVHQLKTSWRKQQRISWQGR